MKYLESCRKARVNAPEIVDHFDVSVESTWSEIERIGGTVIRLVTDVGCSGVLLRRGCYRAK